MTGVTSRRIYLYTPNYTKLSQTLKNTVNTHYSEAVPETEMDIGQEVCMLLPIQPRRLIENYSILF